jgi:hypothetical protein
MEDQMRKATLQTCLFILAVLCLPEQNKTGPNLGQKPPGATPFSMGEILPLGAAAMARLTSDGKYNDKHASALPIALVMDIIFFMGKSDPIFY